MIPHEKNHIQYLLEVIDRLTHYMTQDGSAQAHTIDLFGLIIHVCTVSSVLHYESGNPPVDETDEEQCTENHEHKV